MRIYVCVKHVPDTAINIKIINDKEYDPEVKCVPNPYDEYGVEEAVSLVEKAKQGEVVALCVGSESAVNTLKCPGHPGGGITGSDFYGQTIRGQ